MFLGEGCIEYIFCICVFRIFFSHSVQKLLHSNEYLALIRGKTLCISVFVFTMFLNSASSASARVYRAALQIIQTIIEYQYPSLVLIYIQYYIIII